MLNLQNPLISFNIKRQEHWEPEKSNGLIRDHKIDLKAQLIQQKDIKFNKPSLNKHSALSKYNKFEYSVALKFPTNYD